METPIQNFIDLCQWDSARFLILSDNVFGTLVYYSHLLPLMLSLIIGFFILFKDKKSLINRLLFLITIFFSLWVLFDLILWSTEKLYFTMFFWSIMVLIEPLIYAFCLYFIDVFISGKDISFKKKLGVFIPLLPIILLLPTNFVLNGFDLTNCYREASEGMISTYYVYSLEIIYSIWIIFSVIRKYKKSLDENKKQIILITLGIILFLLSFVFGNIIGSFTVDWTVGQIGLFGMPVFAGFLAYMVVKFKSFNIKLISSQILVISLGLLVVAVLFIRKIENVKIVISFTLIFIIILGYNLIKSVKKEIDQRERLEVLRLKLEESNLNLENANEKLKGLDKLKSEFVSLASHQLRSPLTAIKGYTSMLIEGDYGELNPKAKEIIDRVLESSSNLTLVVEDLLNVTKIEQGGMKYEMARFDFSELVENTARDLSVTAEGKGLKLIYNIHKDKKYFIKGDKEKLRQVLINLIDNSIKYTPTGQIEASLDKKNNKIILSIKDTGVGIAKEVIGKLFEKFSREDKAELNSSGQALGFIWLKNLLRLIKDASG